MSIVSTNNMNVVLGCNTTNNQQAWIHCALPVEHFN